MAPDNILEQLALEYYKNVYNAAVETIKQKTKELECQKAINTSLYESRSELQNEVEALRAACKGRTVSCICGGGAAVAFETLKAIRNMSTEELHRRLKSNE